MEKLIKQRLASPIPKGDNKGAKGLLIKVYTDVSIVTNPLVSTVAVAIVKAIVKDIAKVITKAITTFSTTTNTGTKAKGEVEVKENTFIKEQFCILLKIRILLFVIASALLIMFT